MHVYVWSYALDYMSSALIILLQNNVDSYPLNVKYSLSCLSGNKAVPKAKM